MPVIRTALPRDILTMIGDFAHIDIYTHDYKKYNKLTRLWKIELRCDLCHVGFNRLNCYYDLDIWSDLETYKLDYFKDCDIFYFCNKCKKYLVPTKNYINVFNENRFMLLSIVHKNDNVFYFKNNVIQKVQYYRYRNKYCVVPCKDITNALK